MPRIRWFIALLAVVIAAGSCAHSDSQLAVEKVSSLEIDAAASSGLAPFSKSRAMSHVRKLATDIGVRVRSTSGERRGARYIKKRFRHLGYKVNVQKFDVDGGTSRNVVAWWPGATRFPVVIGGHMDSVPASPGANDNASGVAVVLELARIFADRRPSRYVKWIAFGSEEYGADGRHHVGSQVYVNRLSAKGRKRMAGMISVDMIADGRPLIVGTAGIGPEIVARTLLRRLGKAGIKGEYRTTCDCSDNGPFERAGIPAAFAWSGDEPNYHLPSDTVQNMAPRDLLRTGRAVRAFVRGLDRALIQRFRSK